MQFILWNWKETSKGKEAKYVVVQQGFGLNGQLCSIFIVELFLDFSFFGLLSYYLVLIWAVYLDFFISLHTSFYSHMYLQCPAFLVSQF